MNDKEAKRAQWKRLNTMLCEALPHGAMLV